MVQIRYHTKIFKQKVVAQLPKLSIPEARQKEFHRSCYQAVIRIFALKVVPGSSPTYVVDREGRNYIRSKIEEDLDNCEKLAAEGVSALKASGQLDKFVLKATMKADEDMETESESSEDAPPQPVKRTRNEFSPEEDQALIEQVVAGIPITRIHLGTRDRKTIADHYKVLQKRARLEGRELPNPKRIYAVRSPPVTPTKIRTLSEPKPTKDDSN